MCSGVYGIGLARNRIPVHYCICELPLLGKATKTPVVLDNTNLLFIFLVIKSIHISCKFQSFCYLCKINKNYGIISSYN